MSSELEAERLRLIERCKTMCVDVHGHIGTDSEHEEVSKLLVSIIMLLSDLGQYPIRSEEVRKSFEDWAKSKDLHVHRQVNSIDPNGYGYQSTDWAWRAWQAARSQPAASSKENAWQKSCPDFPNCPNIGCPCEPKVNDAKPSAPRVVNDADVQNACDTYNRKLDSFGLGTMNEEGLQYASLPCMRAALESIAHPIKD